MQKMITKLMTCLFLFSLIGITNVSGQGTLIFSNGPLITQAKQGFNDSDVSAMMDGSQTPGYCETRDDGTCNPPLRVTTTASHLPNWYGVNVTWDIPASKNAEPFFTNGPIVTHVGQGYGGADVSAIMDGFIYIGFRGTQKRGFSIADDFVLTANTQIDSICFYTMSEADATNSPGPNVRELYIRIYDGAPNAGGQIIWGDFTTNIRSSIEIANIFRTPITNLTGSTLEEDARPIMKTYAIINTSLQAGTYWIEVSADGAIPITVPTSNILFCPVTIAGNINTGNGLIYNGTSWVNLEDPGNNGIVGLAMDVYGSQDFTKYNVYRNDVKLTSEPIEELNYYDIAPEIGTYTYGVTAVYSDGCESPQTVASIEIEADPCETPITISSIHVEGFENGSPDCWTEESDGQNQSWEFVLGNVSEPATTHQGSRKAYFYGNNGATTKLITNIFDITPLNAPELSFWYAIKEQAGNQDELHIYYKNNATDSWSLLETLTTNTTDWTKAAITLPYSGFTYWIAFEAKGNGGYGVMLDEVTIQEAGGTGCTAPQNLSYDLYSSPEEWYNVNLTWDYPAGAMPGDSEELWNNGPLITHYGEGYNNANVSAVENDLDIGANTDQLSGYSIADDFVLDKPTNIEHMVFYLYQKNNINNDPSYVSMLFVMIYDGSPKEGGQLIWGNTTSNRINRQLTTFSNIYRTNIDGLLNNNRPLIRVVADINLDLPAGTYWVEIIAVSKIPPYEDGCIFVPSATRLGEPYTGNALQFYSNQWDNWNASFGQCALPFEVYGKQLPLSFDLYRDGNKINDEAIIDNVYTDVVPGAGTYEYCVKAVWENDCTSDAVCVPVEMVADPCETAISSFPFKESFENSTVGYLEIDCWRHELVSTGEDSYLRKWEIAGNGIGIPGSIPEGSQKALFQAAFGATTKLITPKLDLSSLENPTLRFWHVQREWYTYQDQDELRVYYKNTPDGAWTILTEYTEDIPDWRREKIVLPAKSDTYWIAFEAVSKGGRAVMLDDIVVSDACDEVENLAVEVSYEETSSAVLSWESSASTFDIYRNNQLIATNVSGTTYSDEGFDFGINEWCVVTVCGVNTSDPVCITHTPVLHITTTKTGEGTIIPSENAEVSYGDDITIRFAPASGYDLNSVIIDGISVPSAVNDKSYSFINVTEDHSIVVEFTPAIYTIIFRVKDNNAQSIEGVTIETDNQTLTTSSSGDANIQLGNGTYTYRASKAGYSTIENDFVVDGAERNVDIVMLNINSNTGQNKLQLYPNPTQDKITIIYNDHNLQYIQVFDVAGKLVQVFDVSNDNTTISLDLSNIANGVYFIAIGDKKIKVIKQ